MTNPELAQFDRVHSILGKLLDVSDENWVEALSIDEASRPDLLADDNLGRRNEEMIFLLGAFARFWTKGLFDEMSEGDFLCGVWMADLREARFNILFIFLTFAVLGSKGLWWILAQFFRDFNISSSFEITLRKFSIRSHQFTILRSINQPIKHANIHIPKLLSPQLLQFIRQEQVFIVIYPLQTLALDLRIQINHFKY